MNNVTFTHEKSKEITRLKKAFLDELFSISEYMAEREAEEEENDE
jgi:hypothetical protein